MFVRAINPVPPLSPESLLPMNPEHHLTPALSSFGGGEGDEIVILIVVHGFNAPIGFGNSVF
jgi:hypothetical protein